MTPSSQPSGSSPGIISSLQVVVGALVLAAVFVFAATISPKPNVGFADGVKALAVISAGAIAIERILEVFWTWIGMTKGSWWPISLVGDEINKWTAGLDSALAPVYASVNSALDTAATDAQWTVDMLVAAKKELDDMQQRIKSLQQLAPDNQRVELIATAAFQNVSYLQKRYPGLVEGVDAAHQAITGLQDFAATFKDNPGRRVISIYLGMLLGMVGAGFAGLDLFQAAGDFGSNVVLGSLTLHVTVALTGVVIGLGSNPTHDIIRAIQEFKKTQTLGNAATPTTPGDGGDGGDRAPFQTGLRATSNPSTNQLKR